MYIPGMVTGVMQLVLGIYGYFGAEQCDPRKVRNYFHWVVFTVGLEALYLIAGYLSVEQFCHNHNCEKADKGYCSSKVCVVFEGNHDNYHYYKLPCALTLEGQADHPACVSMFRQSIIIEMCVIIPLYIYCALVVFSLHRKLLRGDIVPFEDEDSTGASTTTTTKVGFGSTVYAQPEDDAPSVPVTVSEHERAGLLGNS